MNKFANILRYIATAVLALLLIAAAGTVVWAVYTLAEAMGRSLGMAP